MAEDFNKNIHSVVQILDSWSVLGRAIIALVALAAICLGAAWIIIVEILPSNTSELQIGSTHILLREPTKNGGISVLVVSPQGWNQTGIKVRAGQTIEIHAGGKVNTDLNELIRALGERSRATQRIKDEQAKKNPKDPDARQVDVPAAFTANERRNMLPIWAWIGPDGIRQDLMNKHANKYGIERSIMKNIPYGTLIGAFNPVDMDPTDCTDPNQHRQLIQELQSPSALFRIGSRDKEIATAQRSGFLYLTVNDVFYNPHPEQPNESRDECLLKQDENSLFFLDNIGAYYVSVEISDK